MTLYFRKLRHRLLAHFFLTLDKVLGALADALHFWRANRRRK